MSRTSSMRRTRWFIVGLVTTVMVTIGSIAIGVAMTDPSNQIILVLDGDINEFRYGAGNTQPVNLDRNECDVADASLDGDIMQISATTYDKKGRMVDPAPVGLVEDGMGVNEKAVGNGQDCGRVDQLDDGLTEALVLELGPDVLANGQMISSVDFDFEAKFDAQVRIGFLRSGVEFDSVEPDPFSDGSDSGPDSKFRDKYKYTASSPFGLFDGVSISMVTGGVSLEGGATWAFSDEDVEDHRTVFHLVDATPEVAIEVATNGDDADLPTGPYVPLGEAVTWTYVVTNPGDLPLSSVIVSDDSGVTIGSPSGDDNNDGILDTTEIWTYSASGTAAEDQYANIGSVSATPPFGADVTASDPSHYFGSNPSIAIDVATNGPGVSPPTDGPYINTGDAVTWTYKVTNTGNVTLTNVTVQDSKIGAVTGCATELAKGASSTCTATGTAMKSDPDIPYANTGTATGTPEVGSDVTGSNSSSYFGSSPGIDIDVSNNGPLILVGTDTVWDFVATNTGNVPLNLVIVTDDDDVVVCWNLGDDPTDPTETTVLDPGESASCRFAESTEEGPASRTFTANGTDPLGTVKSSEPQSVSYYGSFNCGDSTTAGEPGLADSPRVGFYIGPNSKPGGCAVPVEITSDNIPGVEQLVSVGPPSEYDWTGVTGVLTIEWDEETPDDTEGVGRTYQRVGGTDDIIPWCAEVVGVVQSDGEWFYELSPDELHPDATGSTVSDPKDVCLIFQNTETVWFDDDGDTVTPDVIRTQTTEVFYIWNDPIFSRPR
jgi:hypothetical protein